MTSATTPRSMAYRIVRGLVVFVLVVLLLPYVVAPFYRVFDPISTPMLARWMMGGRVERTFVPMERIAPIMARSVIASEDAKFCTHRGIDWGELKAAMEDADDLSEMRGASTITQQTTKNLFLWGGRSVVRKALEFPLAIWIDLVLPKQRVLEIYLNIAEFGPGGRFGVESGARWAFNKPARDLTASEAALLTAVLPNPYRRSARQPGPAVRRIAGRVERRAARSSEIDACVKVR